MANVSVRGGAKARAYLRDLAKRVGTSGTLEAGFMEDATYDDGTPVALVAAVNEFGGTVNVPEHTTTIYRQVNAAGTGFLKGGRFVKEQRSNFATDHVVPAHTITIPPRPFMRNTIARHQGEWGKAIANAIKAGSTVPHALGLLGLAVTDEIVQSIVSFSDPPNAPSTIAKKGKDSPLRDTMHMARSVTFRVKV